MDTTTIPVGFSILIVDDDETICDMLKAALAVRYGSTATALCVTEAKALIDASAFDLVVTDLMLPDGSGLDVLTHVKSRDEFAEVLMITGYASLDSATEAINRGAGSYLLKPFSISDFLSSVEKLSASRLFHKRSLELMNRTDLVDPAVKGHVDDITSLYYFTSKLMLTLEISEVMRITLEEVNQKTGAEFCSIGVNALDYAEIYSMPRTGLLTKEQLSNIFATHWDTAFSYMDREKFESGGVPQYIYKGRQGDNVNLPQYKCVTFQLIVIGKVIGGLSIWLSPDKKIAQGLNQYLYVLTSIVSPIIEHVYKDLQARFQAKTDSLTGIANHRQFYESLEREISRANRRKSCFALVLADIDNFKSINDTYGHQTGDAVIIELTRRMLAGIRTGDLAARYGGEEFCLILPDTDREGALILANRICESVAGTEFADSKHKFHYTASFGLAIYDGNRPVNKDELIFKADEALYTSKKTGKNRVTAEE